MKFIFALLAVVFFSKASAQTIIVPGDGNPYYIEIMLAHALSYSPKKEYKIEYYGEYLPKLRALNQIASKQGIDIIAAGATREREALLRPIRFPLLKGLYGWRIPLVNNKYKDLFKGPLSLQAFKQLKPGQLHSWSDTKVIESNGIEVIKGSSFKGLFQMLANERFDYFPRSVLEVEREYLENKHLPLAIDQHIIIQYPTAYYYYVHKENVALAQDIQFGLEQALKDGSFERIFMEHYSDAVKYIKNSERRIYKLDNPFLSEETPLNRKELWL